MIDLGPATDVVSRLFPGLRDDQLGRPTPCAKFTVADLLDHLDGLSVAFVSAARKELDGAGQVPTVDGSRLSGGWRTRIPQRLDELAEAWRDPSAWEGTTKAGDVELSGNEAGMVALTEVVLHGWDLARATGQAYEPDERTLAACHENVAAFAAAGPVEGLFGPAVPVADDAPLLDRVVALAGRAPRWPTR
jgi:uncharacterized protein (TIGR03086 family)